MKSLLLRAHGELDLIKRENKKVTKLYEQKCAELNWFETKVSANATEDANKLKE